MKEVLVTGATSGIGRAMAIALQQEGFSVTALGRNAKALAEMAEECPGLTPLCVALSDRAAMAEALQGRCIDVLINNAGTMPKPGPFDAMDMADIDQTVEINLSSVLWLTHLVLPQMRARKSGHLLFTGSSAAHAPGANFAVYAATKAAISALATSIRAEVSADGIRVTELVPGRVETALYADVLSSDQRAAMYAGGGSLQPSDISDAVLAVLRLPPHADITRLDIMPTRPVPAIQLK